MHRTYPKILKTSLWIEGKLHHFDSKSESRWAVYLENLRRLGAIEKWERSPRTFWFEGIRRGIVSYRPDFKVWENGKIVWHEFKGHLTQADVVKFKRMAKYFPGEKVVLVMQRQPRRESLRLQQAAKYVERIVYANELMRKFNIK